MSDNDNIIEAVEAMTAAFHAGDIEGVMAAYEPRATIAFAPGVGESDRVAQRSGFQSFFAVHPKFSYAGHDVLVAGDLAVHFAPWKMTGEAPDGAKIEQRGLSVAVLRRQADGTWKMVIDNPYGDRLLVERDT